MSQDLEVAPIAELHLMWPAEGIEKLRLGPKQYRPKLDTPPLIPVEPTLADVKIGEIFTLNGVDWRKMNSEGGCRKAYGRPPKSLTPMDLNLKVHLT